jgi:hypothetical protein
MGREFGDTDRSLTGLLVQAPDYNSNLKTGTTLRGKTTSSRLSSWPLACFYCECQVISTRTGISFFTGMVNSEGGSILKSDSVAGTVPEILV